MIIINITKLFELILMLSLRGSILAVGILLVKNILKGKLSAGFHYYVWFLLIVRLIVPFNLESPLNINALIPWQNQSIATISRNLPDSQTLAPNGHSGNGISDAEPVKSDFPAKGQGLPHITFSLIWLIGISGFTVYIITVNIVTLLKISKYPVCSRKDVLSILEDCKRRVNVNAKVTVLYNRKLKSPMVCGLLHPKIIISPEVLDRLSQKELEYVFLHELSHLKRKDLIINILGMMLQAVYWFNPLIWYAIYRMKQDCEISCDADVMKVLVPDEKKKYGLTIINMMEMVSESNWIPGTVSFASKFNKRRITMITFYKNASLKWTLTALLIMTLLTGCSSLTGSNHQSNAGNSAGAANQNGQNQTQADTDNKGQDTAGSNDSGNSPSDTATDTSNTTDTKDNSSENSSKTAGFEEYMNYLGLSKEEITKTLNEKPAEVDEGGLEFTKAGIRVWFNQDKVSQVFTQREDIDFNGAKIGDKIDKFKEAFGKPEKEENGTTYFKYKEKAYISVYYDTETNDTYAVYLLTEMF